MEGDMLNPDCSIIPGLFQCLVLLCFKERKVEWGNDLYTTVQTFCLSAVAVFFKSNLTQQKKKKYKNIDLVNVLNIPCRSTHSYPQNRCGDQRRQVQCFPQALEDVSGHLIRNNFL